MRWPWESELWPELAVDTEGLRLGCCAPPTFPLECWWEGLGLWVPGVPGGAFSPRATLEPAGCPHYAAHGRRETRAAIETPAASCWCAERQANHMRSHLEHNVHPRTKLD